MNSDKRPNPDELLELVQNNDSRQSCAQLRIYFGMSAGVGKTYSMLQAAHDAKNEGHDVVIGVVETHGRIETAALLEGLETIPKKKVEYRGTFVEEMDLDSILIRKPQIVIVDELPHTNAPGSTHPKRYQDVLDILDAGIDVYTAVNVQHIESRKESVERITGVPVRETVPDSILERANQIELIDITPRDLLKRLREGKVYLGERAEAAAANFFKEGPLSALRELALRLTAEKVDSEIQDYTQLNSNQGPWNTNERLMVAVSHSPYSERLIRATRRLAFNLEAPWIAVNIDTGLHLGLDDQNQLSRNLTLARELGAEVITISDVSITDALKTVARHRNVTQLVIGQPTRRIIQDRIQGGTQLDQLVRQNCEFDVHVIRQETPIKRRIEVLSSLSVTFSDYWKTILILIVVTLLAQVCNEYLGYKTIGFFYLGTILATSLIFSLSAVLLSSVLGILFWDFFFVPPLHSFFIEANDDLLFCASMIVVAVTTGMLARRVKVTKKIYQDRERRTQLLYHTNRAIVTGGARDIYLPKICGHLSNAFDGEFQFFMKEKDKDFYSTIAGLADKERAVATWAFEHGKTAGWSTENLPLSEKIYLPVYTRSEKYGVLCFKPANKQRLGLERENMLYTVTSQIAISIEREFLEQRLR